jgi:hypothetical protein
VAERRSVRVLLGGEPESLRGPQAEMVVILRAAQPAPQTILVAALAASVGWLGRSTINADRGEAHHDRRLPVAATRCSGSCAWSARPRSLAG